MNELALKIPGGNVVAPPQVERLSQGANAAYGGNVIAAAIIILFIASACIALIYIVLGGIKWIMSEGDPKNIAAARIQIIFACVGLAVAFLSFLIVNFMGNFFNVKFF